MAGDLQPLVSNQPITNADGTPTEYFIRWAQERQIDIQEGISADQAEALIADYLAAHVLQAGVGIKILPDGKLSSDPTISLDAKLGDLSDVDLTTPPTDGQVIVFDAATETWLPADQSGSEGGGGIYAPLVNGVLPGPILIAGSVGQCIMVRIR